MPSPAAGRAFARAALAGNPSDGYGGRTLAVVVPAFCASADVLPAAEDRAAIPLVRAAVERFRARLGVGPVEVRWTTTVPREVGLGGSSAIVIAVLRALGAAAGVVLEPGELAAMALAVEAEDLGIAAGLQDRLVQAHEALLAMDFSAGAQVEVLDPALLPPLFVAWRADAAQPSGVVHGELRARWVRGDAEVRSAMAELAGHAGAARDALVAGDASTFGACMDASLEVRRRMMGVDPRVERMVDVARSFGAYVNSAGSGGAIVGTLPGPGVLDALRADGCGVVELRPGAATRAAPGRRPRSS